MKTRQEVHAAFDAWCDDGSVGMFIVHSSPKGTYLTWQEKIVKMKDLPAEEAGIVTKLMESHGAIKIDLKSSKDGHVDRISVTKSL